MFLCDTDSKNLAYLSPLNLSFCNRVHPVQCPGKIRHIYSTHWLKQCMKECVVDQPFYVRQVKSPNYSIMIWTSYSLHYIFYHVLWMCSTAYAAHLFLLYFCAEQWYEWQLIARDPNYQVHTKAPTITSPSAILHTVDFCLFNISLLILNWSFQLEKCCTPFEWRTILVKIESTFGPAHFFPEDTS